MYLYTVNAFPYGPFKNTIVKKQVYEPDWRSDERAIYTMQVADILAEIGGANVNPSIQSPPLGFKPRVTGPDVVAAYTRQVIRVVAHLVKLEQRTGRTVTLALEPEPYCFLETTEEALDYFKNHLYATDSVRSIVTQTGLSKPQAEAALRNHLGMVYDICHQAVEYEDIGASLRALADAGIPVFKLQEAAALHMPTVTQKTVDALRPLRRHGVPHADRRAAQRQDHALPQSRGRVRGVGQGSGPARMAHSRARTSVPRRSRRVQDHALRDRGRSRVPQKVQAFPQLEIETYTWDVLPDNLKTGDIVEYVQREIEWVKSQLL